MAYDIPMDDRTQEKIDQAAKRFAEVLRNDIVWIANPDKGLLSSYQKDLGYSPTLASFLTIAQDVLIKLVEGLTERIFSKICLGNIRTDFENVRNDLQGFSDTIKVGTGFALSFNNTSLKQQIEDDFKALQSDTSSWNGSKLSPSDKYVLEEYPIFSVKPAEEREEPQEQGEKLYTVFVGSTYEDMKDIREAVLQRLNSSKEYMPIGMENFMASYSRQLEYIRERLKNTDIYVLILGGRYGTLIPKDDKTRPDEEDKSYTQKEYEMAMKDPDIRVLAFVCNDPDNLPSERRYKTDVEHERLNQFVEKVENRIIVRPWNPGDSPEMIAGDVFQSLTQEDKSTLRGWVRGASHSSAK